MAHKQGKAEKSESGRKGGRTYLPARPKVVLCAVCRMRCCLLISQFALALINAATELCDVSDAGVAKVHLTPVDC